MTPPVRPALCHSPPAAGMDFIPGCGFTATAPTEEELMKKVVAHAGHDHGVTDVTPELAARVKAAIRG